MRIGRWMMLTVAAAVAASAPAEAVLAQYHYDKNFEIATMATLSQVTPESGPAETILSIPGGSQVVPGSAGLRFAHHHHAFPNLLEFGLSIQSSKEMTITSGEVAVGSTLGPRQPAPQAFVLGILGVLHTSNGSGRTGVYVGGQAGLRLFLDPRVAARVQFGYRDFMGDKFRFNVVEFGLGIGVFL